MSRSGHSEEIDNPKTFEEWVKELNTVSVDDYGYIRGAAIECGAECWRGYFEDGLTPAEALAEDSDW